MQMTKLPWRTTFFTKTSRIEKIFKYKLCRVVDPSKKVPDLDCKVQDLLIEVVDLKQEVPDLRSGGILPQFNPRFHSGGLALKIWRKRAWLYTFISPEPLQAANPANSSRRSSVELFTNCQWLIDSRAALSCLNRREDWVELKYLQNILILIYIIQCGKTERNEENSIHVRRRYKYKASIKTKTG